MVCGAFNRINTWIIHLQNRKWGTEDKDEDIRDGEIDKKDVDDCLEFRAGGHWEADQHIASQAAHNQDTVYDDQHQLIRGNLLEALD